MKELLMRAPWLRTRLSVLLPVAAAATLVASASIWAISAPPAAASTPVVVTLGFDDGTVD